VDLVPERLEMARRHGVEVFDAGQIDDVPAQIIDATEGRGPDSVIDAVGLEAHGNPLATLSQKLAAVLPDVVGRPMAEQFGVDRLRARPDAIATVRRGGTSPTTRGHPGSRDSIPRPG